VLRLGRGDGRLVGGVGFTEGGCKLRRLLFRQPSRCRCSRRRFL